MSRKVVRARERGRPDPQSQLVPLYPLALERSLVRAVERYHRDFVSQVRAEVVRRDSLLELGARPRTELVRMLTRYARRIVRFQDRQTARLLSLDPRTFQDRNLSGQVNNWVSGAVSYLVDAESQLLDAVERAVLEGGDVAAAIEERGRVSTSRAKLIARDQVANLNREVSRYRQQAVGVTEYRWVTSMDERVRPEHASLNGKKFRWDDPPPEGHPGEAIQCRCVARPLPPDGDEDLFG